MQRFYPAVVVAVVSLDCFAGSFVGAEELTRATPQSVGLSADGLREVTKACEDLVRRKECAGTVVGVVRHGKLVYLQAVGFRDIENAVPMTTDTIFRIYSMTKPITTTAAMMLWEEGKFGLDDPVSRYIPEFRNVRVWGGEDGDGNPVLLPPKRPITIRDLMRHTAGLTYGFYGNTAVDRRYLQANLLDRNSTPEQFIRKLTRIPLLYHPGERWHYSVSVDVLGCLVEKVSNQPLDLFLKERIFDPLDMRDTGFYVPEQKLGRFAVNYTRRGESLVAIDRPETSPYRRKPSFPSGGGGLVSTARDYLHFCAMLLNGGELFGRRILKPDTVRLMTTNQLGDIGYIGIVERRVGVGFGLGFSVVVKPGLWDRHAVKGEYGWSGAASTHFWISPTHDLAVVALHQRMPFTNILQQTVKPLVYRAVKEESNRATPSP